MSDITDTPAAQTPAEPIDQPTNTPTDPPAAQAPATDNIFGGVNSDETYDFSDTCASLGLEMSQEASDGFIAVCKENGIGNEQANKLAAYGLKLQKDAADSVIAAQIEREKGWANTFREEAGKDYDAKLQKIGIAKEWAEKLLPGFTQMAVDTGAGNHPIFLNLMARLGDMVGEENGTRLDNGTAGGSSTMYDKTDFSKYK